LVCHSLIGTFFDFSRLDPKRTVCHYFCSLAKFIIIVDSLLTLFSLWLDHAIICSVITLGRLSLGAFADQASPFLADLFPEVTVTLRLLICA